MAATAAPPAVPPATATGVPPPAVPPAIAATVAPPQINLSNSDSNSGSYSSTDDDSGCCEIVEMVGNKGKTRALRGGISASMVVSTKLLASSMKRTIAPCVFVIAH
jgi:hypothetical protein